MGMSTVNYWVCTRDGITSTGWQYMVIHWVCLYVHQAVFPPYLLFVGVHVWWPSPAKFNLSDVHHVDEKKEHKFPLAPRSMEQNPANLSTQLLTVLAKCNRAHTKNGRIWAKMRSVQKLGLMAGHGKGKVSALCATEEVQQPARPNAWWRACVLCLGTLQAC